MSTLSKSLLILVGIFSVLFIAYSFYDRQFKLSNIRVENILSIESSPVTDQEQAYLKEIFSQSFYYLDRGKQSYVFVSNDQKYILKLFDNRCLRSGPLPFLFSISEKQCKKKLRRVFEGYYVAAKHDPTHTGLLFLQLSANPTYHLNVLLTDRFGI